MCSCMVSVYRSVRPKRFIFVEKIAIERFISCFQRYTEQLGLGLSCREWQPTTPMQSSSQRHLVDRVLTARGKGRSQYVPEYRACPL